jgi:uncharacterized membrane protein YhaH (DUF805 family)
VKIFRRFSTERLNRRNFALGMLFYSLINIIVMELVKHPAFTDMTKGLSNVEYALLILLLLLYISIMVVFLLSLIDRRLQDMGRDITEFPSIPILWPLLLCLFLKGENKENKYGKPPEPKIDLKGLFGFS